MSEAEAEEAALAPYLALLRGFHADATEHSGRHLIDHLTGTWRLLDGWGNRRAVCRAGLFHSIYGTNSFPIRSAAVSDRPAIRAAIGDEAERLAFLFCTTDRPVSLLRALVHRQAELPDLVNGGTHAVSPAELAALIEIEVANLVEQPNDPELLAHIARIILAAVPVPVTKGAAAALSAAVAVQSG